jgi:ABC-2 type transport system ATP-binding protein
MIRVQDLRKGYGTTVAVDGLSFEVHPGQVLGLVGPNGAGKTTTLRAIAGVIAPTHGTLKIAGFDVQRAPLAAKARLAYVPDDPRLFDALTVHEHLIFAARAYGVEGFAATADRLLAQFELTDRRNTLAQELSRGMRQKVAICAAYVHDPAAILFDEPLTGLDPHAIRTLKNSIRQRAAAGTAVVVSSHLLSLIEDLCTHLLVLHRGRALFLGSLDDVHAAVAAGPGGKRSLEDAFFAITGEAFEHPEGMR